MSKKKPVTTKRGQHHQYKSFWINLIKDINLTKIDTNVVRKHPDSFEKKKVRLEKRNSDPLYFRQTVLQEFQSLSDGVDFSFWRLSKNSSTLIPLPPEIDNATSLCNYDELNRSSLYIRLQAPPHFLTPSTSSTQPHQILELMDSTLQQADDESSISQGTSALQVETGIPGDDGGKKQILKQSSWIVTHEWRPDGELLLLPMRQASPTAMSITMQPTASVAEEAVANKGEMLELLAKEKSVDRGGEHSSRVPKKRKITTETGQEFMGAKQYQRSSAQERDLMNEHIADFWNRDNLNSFSSTVQANGVPSADAMDNDTGVVAEQFTQDASGLFNYQHQQLLIDNRGFSSSLTNFNYHGNRDQPQPMIGLTVPQKYTLQTKDSGAWDLGQRSMVVPYPLHASCPSNFTDPYIGLHTSYPFNANDPITTPVRQNMQYPCQQRPNAADAGHSIQQHFDSRIPQPQQPLNGLDMVPQNASNSENTCVSQENLSNVTFADASESEMPCVQLIGRVADIQMQKDKTCGGAAVLQDHMYLIYDYTNTVYIHSSDPPYGPLSQIVHEEMKDLYYIVASVEHNCVYIAERRTIWKLVRNAQACEMFLSFEWIRSISVNKEGHLLVAMNYFGDPFHLRTFDADGSWIQVIDIGPQGDIFDAVQSGAEKVFVYWNSYGENCKAMSELSLNGVVLHTYGPHIAKYFDCGGMSVGEGDQIFVIDRTQGGRILVFGSRARLIGVLLGKDDHRIKEINGLCYIKDKKQLLVIGSDRVNIYQLNKNRGPQLDGHWRKVALDVEDPVLCNIHVSKFPHAQLLGEIKSEWGYNVLGIAAMNDKLYIAYKNKDTVLIYNSNSPFHIEKELRVNGMKYPHRIQAYAENNCLFISDGEEASSKCIWIVKDGDVCEKLLEDIDCCSLSVTHEGELLIVDNKHKCIHLYKTDGRCFSCVKLPDEIDSDQRVYAVKSLRESFYVSAVWTREYKNNKTLYSMVYEVSKDGDIVKTFSGRAGSGSGQLSGSNHPMAVDKNGRLIVGDEGNNRILMLDSNLQLLTIVLEKHGFRNGEFYMGANADLLFAHDRWQDISVFTLSQSQPNRMIESSNNISSKAMSGKDEFHLLFSIERHTWKEIRGIATLMDSIYVLYRYSITVYDGTNPYTKKYKQYYDDGDLWDIAANVSDGCLYVTDKRKKCVWSAGVDLRPKTLSEGIGSPYTLSVANDGSVLVLSNKDQSLNIYDKDVHLLKQIRVSFRKTMHLQHAVQLSYSRENESYLICHGLDINHAAVDDYDYDSDFLSHEVFVVSSNGDIIQTFGGKFGSNLDQLNLPSHIVFYRDSTILVADCNNNRVLRLDHQLNLRNIPLSMDVQGIKEPFRLCYSEKTGHMIVANSNSVDIFANDDFIRCPGEDEQSSSDSAVNTDASESEMPYVLLIGQVDIQMQKDKVCRGAAVLQDRLYLIYKGVDTVYVHSSDHPYGPLSQIVRQEMKNPWHIVASVEHNCVYITARSTIWRLVRNGQECETFLSFECVCSISVNEEGHLLVATKDDIEEPSYVRTYDADGRCIQVIEFCLYRNISYAVQSGAKKVFVNWSCFGENENCKAMSEVSLNGVLLHTYGPHINEFFKCRGMSLGEGDQVFVIDKSNGGRILVFGSRARLIGVLMGKDDHQMTKIAGLCYIKDKKQLLVIGSDRINVYQLNKNRGPKIYGHCRKEALEEEDTVLCKRHGDTGQLLYSRKVYYEQGQLSLRAVGELGEKQYLLYSNSLEVFSRKDFVTKTDFGREARKIPEDRPLNFSEAGLWDMAASEIDLCLYVTDRYNHCVWSVTIDHKIKKWLANIGSPYTLSGTEDGSLCILSNYYKHLHIFDRSGSRTKSIELPRHMRYLLHAVQTPKGTYIISWTGNVKYDGIRRNGNDFVKENSDTKKDYEEEEEERWFLDDEDVVFEERHKSCVCSEESETQKRGLVCEISSDGSILRSFSANDPQHDQIGTFDSRYLFKLEKPCHLALDHEGRVFVADYHGSGSVLLLDTQLKFLANLTENFHREGYKAKRLCYDKSNKELTVIQYHCHDYTILGIRVQCQ